MTGLASFQMRWLSRFILSGDGPLRTGVVAILAVPSWSSSLSSNSPNFMPNTPGANFRPPPAPQERQW
ncbi:hypothetical protein [Piscinibacter sp.]|uniref:hypothetical protein n=1 Tax=Piscinibacter sp. TaxID=1903157 RepID=UPI001DD5293A|nr:hypothetical protein [Piscinibacter sp.]MBK7531639.1 hypothetical protein [Piscinibacter sp.]